MNYLTRPVFQFQVNWSAEVARGFNYDLRAVDLGFGADVFTSRALYVVNGWQFACELTSASEIATFDTFFDERKGRLIGFWLPVPMVGMSIASGVSSTQFDILDQNLRDAFADSPDLHLYFDDGNTRQCAKITTVALSGTLERVTVNTALSPAPTADTKIYRLHYVRLAEPVEAGEMFQEHHQRRQVAVVELPNEYTTAETGERPIYLYHFWCEAPIGYDWFFTSFESNVISDSNEHVAANISHGTLRKSTMLDAEKVTIQATYESDHPLSMFIPIPTGRRLNVSISKTTFASPDVVTRLFTGEVRVVNDGGGKLTAQCDSFVGKLKQRIPAMLIKPGCAYRVFDRRTCKAVLAKFQTSGHITAIDNDAQPPQVHMSLRFPTGSKILTDWFAQGYLETGLQLDFELRTIFASSWDAFDEILTLTINAPLMRAVVGQEVQLIPGCDGTAATCSSKFDNFVNYSGIDQVPDENPSMRAIDNRRSTGDKK